MKAKGIFARSGALTAVIIGIIVALIVANQSKAATPFPDAATARFGVTVSGEGPDVILIPGLGCSRDVWDATVARFKGTHRLHVLNIAGFAGEPAAANAQGEVIAPSVEALNAYIAAQKLTKPVVVGHSMGGLMALMLAQAHPEATDKIVIVDALPFIGTLFGAADVAAIRPQAEAFRSGILNATPEQFAAMQRGMIAGANPPAYGETMVGWTLASDRRVFAQAMYDDMVTDMRPSLPAIKASIVLLYPYAQGTGMAVEQTDAVYAQAYAGAVNKRLVRIDNATHFLMLDQPETFHTVLEAALR